MNTGRTHFKAGRSGNPGGRPKTAKFAEEVRQFLGEQNGNKTRLRQVLEHLQKDDPKILLQYAFGKPVDSMEMEIKGQTETPWISQEIIDAACQVAREL